MSASFVPRSNDTHAPGIPFVNGDSASGAFSKGSVVSDLLTQFVGEDSTFTLGTREVLYLFDLDNDGDHQDLAVIVNFAPAL